MSLGYTGTCRKVAEDDHIVIYSYAGENWNDRWNSKQGDLQLLDGMFTIQKDSFCTCLEKCMQTNAINIDRKCKNAFGKPDIPCDYIAWRLLHRIFDYHQKNNQFPEQASFIQ